MTENDRRVVEAAQTLQHVHDIADMLAARMRGLPAAQAEAMLERELADLAVLTKRLEGKSDAPALAASVGFKISAVMRTRVAAQLAIDS